MKEIKTSQYLVKNEVPADFEEQFDIGHPNIRAREVCLNYAEEMFGRRWLTNNG